MKYVKTYEKVREYNPLTPHTGDFVIVRTNLMDDELKKYFYNNIGQITSIRTHDDICIKYDNVPDNIKNWFRTYTRNGVVIYYTHDTIDNIVVFSRNKKDIELKLNIMKYNI